MIIIDNRIVSDRTFATRLINFLKDIRVNDPYSYDEIDYLNRVAHRLLIHQRDTVIEQREKDYLSSCWPFGIIDGDDPKTKVIAKELL